jgi:hypothetical protein
VTAYVFPQSLGRFPVTHRSAWVLEHRSRIIHCPRNWPHLGRFGSEFLLLVGIEQLARYRKLRCQDIAGQRLHDEKRLAILAAECDVGEVLVRRILRVHEVRREHIAVESSDADRQVAHHDAVLRIHGNSQSIVALALPERNPRKRLWNTPVSPASGHPSLAVMAASSAAAPTAAVQQVAKPGCTSVRDRWVRASPQKRGLIPQSLL